MTNLGLFYDFQRKIELNNHISSV